MKEKNYSQWLTDKYLDWQTKEGDRRTVKDFSELVGISQPLITNYLNGKRKPSYGSALKICKKLNDYELLDILGFTELHKTEFQYQLDSLPKNIQKTIKERLTAATKEVNDEMKRLELIYISKDW